MRQRVAVLFGGKSGEHEVSVASARSVMAALAPARWEVVPLAIGRDGSWLDPIATQDGLDGDATCFDGGKALLEAGSVLGALATCEVAFPLVHGKNGEDGTLQGFLEMAGIPYAGPGVAASAIGMDKALMKALFQEAGIPVAPYGVLRAWEAREQDDTALRFIEANIGYPCFVKPANGGSSVGVSRAESREDMGPALGMAFDYDDKAVVEAAVNGREVEVSVLGNEHPEASVAGEVIPDRTFYDYESKYAASSTTRLVIPAGLPNDVSQRVRDLALRTYQVMGCEGYARVDFFVTADNTVIANEVNTIPGFTSISMYPKLWAASGLEYADLLTRILDLALERHERENRS